MKFTRAIRIRNEQTMKKGNPLRRLAPIAVLVAALSFSAWSLYFVARHLGAPVPVAAVVSTIFDGAAIYLADLAADHTREGDSGIGPRFAVLVLAGISAWLNTLHAQYGGYPADSELLWAAPPIVAVIVYEFTVRYIHRKTLRATGRIATPLPRFDGASWVLFPIKTMRSVRKVVEFRRDVTTALATGEPFGGTPGTFGLTPGTFGQLPAGTSPNMRDVRDWARRTGLRVGQTGPISADILTRYMRALAAGEADMANDSESGESDSGEDFTGRAIES